MIEAAWPLFVAASVLLIVTPGQDMMLVMSRSVAQGAAAGVVTAAGVSVGLVGHTVLAALGLGAILRTSEWLFIALKLVGAAYLVYLGIGLLRTGRAGLALAARERVTLPRLFLPQFVAPGAHQPTLTMFALGIAFAALTFLIKAIVGACAGGLSGWLRARPLVLMWIHRASGALLVALGVRLAFERR